MEDKNEATISNSQIFGFIQENNGTIIIGHSDSRFDYDEFMTRAKFLLQNGELEYASILLQRIPEEVPQFGRANFLLALALLRGRSFNALNPSERKKIEDCVNIARKKHKEWLLPDIVLAIFEIDYYRNHGMMSKNNISPETISKQLYHIQLTDEDFELLTYVKTSVQAKQNLGLRN